MRCDGSKGHRDEYFSAYDEKRDAFRCYNNCLVAVAQPAICLCVCDPKVKDLVGIKRPMPPLVSAEKLRKI